MAARPRCPSCGKSKFNLIGCSSCIIGSSEQQKTEYQCTNCGVVVKVANGVLILPVVFGTRARLGAHP